MSEPRPPDSDDSVAGETSAEEGLRSQPANGSAAPPDPPGGENGSAAPSDPPGGENGSAASSPPDSPPADDKDDSATKAEMTLVEHLTELRNRLLRVVIAIGVVFVACLPFADELYTLLALPLIELLPEGSTMIATEVASPFLTPFKLAFITAIALTIPVALHQAWSFIAPGLYLKEQRLALPLLVSSTVLFFVGMAFAYYLVFPLMFQFFIGSAPEGITVATDIGRYLDFCIKLFFAFGIAFEVPVATFLIVSAGLTTVADLRKKRAYVILSAFVLGMLLTPPDVISQTLLALPMWVLFELGLVMCSLYIKSEQEAGEEEGEAGTAD